jgi:hypothetical protein
MINTLLTHDIKKKFCKKINSLILLLLFFPLFCNSDELKDCLKINDAIIGALKNNQSIHNYCKTMTVNKDDIFKEIPNKISIQNIVNNILSTTKNKTNLQLSALKIDISRYVIDLLLEVKTTFHTYVFLQQSIEYAQKELLGLKKDQDHINTLYRNKQISFKLLKQNERQINLQEDILLSLLEDKEIIETKLLKVLGIENITSLRLEDPDIELNEIIDLESLKGNVMTSKPDLIALKEQMDEIKNYGVKEKLWRKVNDTSIKKDEINDNENLEIRKPLATVIDFKEGLRANLLSQLKQTKAAYESLLNVTLLQLEDAYVHFKNAKERLASAKENKNTVEFKMLVKDFFISKAILEHALGQEL